MSAAPQGEAPARSWRALVVRLPNALAAIMLLALSTVTVIDVVGRYVFRAPIGGADEITVFLMAIGVYAVFPGVTWREEHVCVDIIDLIAPGRWIAPRQIAISLLAAAFMAIVTWRMWVLAARLTEDGEVTMFLRLPRGPLAYFFAVMCAIATAALVANAVRYLLHRGPLQRATPQHGGAAPGDR
jgi:TRAP-type C4-dicarboxylate transport system permease small subunit